MSGHHHREIGLFYGEDLRGADLEAYVADAPKAISLSATWFFGGPAVDYDTAEAGRGLIWSRCGGKMSSIMHVASGGDWQMEHRFKDLGELVVGVLKTDLAEWELIYAVNTGKLSLRAVIPGGMTPNIAEIMVFGVLHMDGVGAP